VNPHSSLSLLTSALVSITLAGSASAQSHIQHLTGQVSGENLGRDIDASSDIDGDGVPDLVLGNPGFAAAGFASGGAAVYSGATGAKLMQVSSDQGTFQFGNAVGAAGDTNGDGLGDFLVGDTWHELAPGVRYGRAWLFSGADGSVLYTIDATLPNDSLGNALCGLGDLDGDLKSDFAVAAYSADTGGQNAGAVSVHSGVDGHVLYTLSGPGSGLAIGADYGAAIANADDLNGDGFDDLIVGAPRESTNSLYAGRVLVYSGVDGALLWDVAATVFEGYFGTSVAAAGDVNGDGVPDVIAGATQFPLGPGYAFVLSGVDGSLIHVVVGNQIAVLFGMAVGTAGDFNGDGKSEFMVGRAGFGEGVRVFDGATATELLDLQSTTVFGAYGAVLDAADLNQDGTLDLVISASGVSTGPIFNHGELDVISPLALPFAPSTTEVSLLDGGTVDFTLEAGSGEAGNLYWILGSVSGSTPGLPLGPGLLPLNPDPYFNFTLTQVNSALLPTSFGNLDATGSAQSSLVVTPASSPTLAGLVVYHAFAVLDSATFGFTAVSNAVTTVLLP
jgi:hypothetical protein